MTYTEFLMATAPRACSLLQILTLRYPGFGGIWWMRSSHFPPRHSVIVHLIGTLDTIMMQLYLLVKRSEGTIEEFSDRPLVEAPDHHKGFPQGTAPKSARPTRLWGKRTGGVRYVRKRGKERSDGANRTGGTDGSRGSRPLR
jgi:hypothetical protein